MNNNNPLKDNFIYNVDNKTIKSHSDADNISLLKTTCQTDNLKVVIRIRPALPREMENDIPFRSIVNNFSKYFRILKKIFVLNKQIRNITKMFYKL